MKASLTCTLVQTPMLWEDVQGNLAILAAKLDRHVEETDLIVLPEMFTTGFSMTPASLAEEMNGPAVNWMKGLAKERNAAVMGSCIVKENGRFYNRLIVVKADGQTKTYDKKHLFTLAGEGVEYTAGTERLIVEIAGWKIMPMVCYDLRFPVWSRMQQPNEYDLLVYVANWPTPRVNAWDTLLKARAIENQSYCIGVNRIGTDGNKLDYSGHSAVYDFGGHTLLDLQNREEIRTIKLERKPMEDFREKLPFLADADEFEISLIR